MNFFTPKTSPVVNALTQVIGLQGGEEWVSVPNTEHADVVFIVDDREMLAKHYRKDKVFAFFSTAKECNLPENVILIGMNEMIHQIASLMAFIKAFKPEVTKREHHFPDNIIKVSRAYRVLVIDDVRENTDFAQALLAVQDHEVTIVPGFADGMKALKAGKFDFVLSDMHMPGNRHYPALSYDSYRLDETYEYGMLMVFEATALGIPVAIVSDGNHHGNWMSAAMDSLKKATVNGQPVLFFNNIGKRWDIALAELEKALAG
jgi:hypothetical protein